MRGQKPHIPTEEIRKKVDAMAGYGVPQMLIARVLNISNNTLRKHYLEELETASIRANTAVAQSLFRKATGDGPQSVTAAIFWAKTRMGWKEPATEADSEALLGKKARQAIAAAAVIDGNSEWGDDLAPQASLRNVN
jgi:hypothetical protein